MTEKYNGRNHDKRSHDKNTHSYKSRRIYACLKKLLFLIIIMIVLIGVHVKNSSYKYIDMSENAQVDYKVYLNNNEFYEDEYRESDKQYVSGLISKITADFSYNLDLGEETSCNYTYRIDAKLNISDSKSDNSIYETTNTLVEEKTLSNNGNSTIAINEELDIDYSEYNNIAKSFLTTYGLSSGCESVLDVILYVKSDNTEESTVTLSIPLDEITISIESTQNLVNESTQILVSAPNNILRYGSIVLILGCVVGIIVTIRYLLKYIEDAMDDDKKYKIAKKRILMAYGDAIDKIAVDYDLNFNDYCTIRLNKFTDLLKIKEDVSQPILMFENKEDTNTVFFIPNNTKFMYIFVLGKERELLADKYKTETKEFSEV